jgi:hypothetical protein
MARPKDKYAYTVEDIAKLTKQPANTVRQHITRGKFHPAELASVIAYINEFNKTQVKNVLVSGYMTAIEDEARQVIIEQSKQLAELKKE